MIIRPVINLKGLFLFFFAELIFKIGSLYLFSAEATFRYHDMMKLIMSPLWDHMILKIMQLHINNGCIIVISHNFEKLYNSISIIVVFSNFWQWVALKELFFLRLIWDALIASYLDGAQVWKNYVPLLKLGLCKPNLGRM